jgi:hypothetical protein
MASGTACTQHLRGDPPGSAESARVHCHADDGIGAGLRAMDWGNARSRSRTRHAGAAARHVAPTSIGTEPGGSDACINLVATFVVRVEGPPSQFPVPPVLIRCCGLRSMGCLTGTGFASTGGTQPAGRDYFPPPTRRLCIARKNSPSLPVLRYAAAFQVRRRSPRSCHSHRGRDRRGFENRSI